MNRIQVLVFSAAAWATLGTTAAVAQDDVVLRFSSWNSGGFIGTNYEQFAQEFAAAHPRVSGVQFEFQPFARYHDVLNVQIAAGDPPEMAWLNPSFGPAYIRGGHLRELSADLAKQEGYDFEDMRPAALKPWQSADGGVYGVPHSNSPNVMYVNLDLFEKAGLPNPETLPEGEWTWDFVRNAAKTIVQSGAAPNGFLFANGLTSNGWRILEDLLAAYGAQPWTADGKTCTMNSAESVAAFKFFHEMVFAEGGHPQPGAEVDFFAGDVGMALARPSQAPSLEGVPYKWTIMPQPRGPAGFHPAIGSAATSILKNSANADLAVEFLAYVTSREASIKMGNAFPSARASTQTVELLSAVNPILSPEQIDHAVIAALSSPDASWGYSHVNWGPVYNNSQMVIDGKLWRADADVEAVLNEVCDTIQPLLY